MAGVVWKTQINLTEPDGSVSPWRYLSRVLHLVLETVYNHWINELA